MSSLLIHRLLASAAVLPATALFGASTPAQAQSVCTGLTGGVLNCVDPVTGTVDGTVNSGTNVVAGPGLTANSATDLIADVSGNITTDGDNQSGVLLTAADNLIFTTSGDVRTLGLNSDGVNLTGASVTANLNDVTTQGVNAQGVQVLSVTGPTNLTVDTIQTNGDLSQATLLRGAGDINLQANVLQTNGMNAAAIDIASDPAACINLGAGGCSVTAAAENVTTNGFGGIGALIAAAGPTTVHIGALQTNNDNAAGLMLTADPTVCAILGAGQCDQSFTVGNLTTMGADSPGALVRGAGNITGSVDVLQTSGDRAVGLDLASDPTACIILGAGQCGTSFTVGTLTTHGAGATGALIRAAGPTTGNVGVLQTNGDNATGIDIAGDPTACVIVGVGVCDVGLTAGQVTTNGNQAAGVLINTVGAITTNLGPVQTAGDNSPGVSLIVDPVACAAIGPGSCVINDQSGPVTTGGDNSPGTTVTGGSDPVTVNTGPTTTTGSDSPGIDVTTTTGDQTIISGGVTTSGPGSNGIQATATGCANIDITATGPVTSAQATAILATTQCAVTVTTGPGATVTGATAGIDVTSGTGATINLGAGVSATAGPAIIAAGAPATVNILSTGSVTGAITLTPGDDSVNNGGVFTAVGTSDFGAGVDVFNNLAGGTVTGSGTTGVLANCETFNNAGTITMLNGVATDALSLCGNYVGSGAANLGVDVGTSAGGLISDRLIISGNASGSTVINPMLVGALVIDPSGVLVVSAASATGTPFTLGGQTSFGLIDLSLAQTSGNTFLVARPNIAAIEPVVVGDLAQNLWYQSADIYSNYSALRRADFGGNRRGALGAWGQAYYSQDKTGGQNYTMFGTDFSVNRFTTNRRGIQGGVDYLFGGNALVGVTGGYERAAADIRSSMSDFRATGYNVGGYAIIGGETGFFGDLLVKYDRAKLKIGNSLFATATGSPHLKSSGAQGEIGYRFGPDATQFDLNAGLAYVRSNIDDYSVGTIAFNYDRMKSTRGHVGARATFGNGAISPFVDAKLFHEFKGDTGLALASGDAFDTIESRGRGTWGRIEAGIGSQNGSGPILAAWADVGDVKGFGVKAGFRFGGDRQAILPAASPPPPPPAPLPTTQTCEDGSVIASNMTCPVAPPPSAPPPPPASTGERG